MKTIITTLLLSTVIFGCSEKEATVEQKETVEETAVSQDSVVPDERAFIECIGEIRVPPTANVSLHSPIGGILKLKNVHEGMPVKKGQVLATLEHIDVIRIQENYLKSKNQLAFREEEYARKKELFEGNAIPKREFQEVETAYNAEKVNFKSLQQQVALLGISESSLSKGQIVGSLNIVSPVSGFLTEILVNNGMYLGPDTEIIRIIEDKEKHVVLLVYADDIGHVQEGQSISFQLSGTDKTYESTIRFIGKSVDETSNTVHVHGELPEGQSDLIVGTKVFGKILLN